MSGVGLGLRAPIGVRQRVTQVLLREQGDRVVAAVGHEEIRGDLRVELRSREGVAEGCERADQRLEVGGALLHGFVRQHLRQACQIKRISGGFGEEGALIGALDHERDGCGEILIHRQREHRRVTAGNREGHRALGADLRDQFIESGLVMHGLDMQRTRFLLVSGKPVEHRGELHHRRELPQLLVREALPGEVFEGGPSRGIRTDLRQVAAHPRLLGVLLEAVAHSCGDDLLEAGERRIDGAELLDERLGALRADAGNAGDVVGGVALERLQFDQLRGLKAVVLADRGEVEALGVLYPTECGDHVNVVIHQLQQVAVAGDDDDLHPLG